MQISFYDGSQPFVIDKPIRLIELFAGYGSQAFALKYLGVEFEHWKICEWAVKSIQAYKDAHFPDDNTDYSAFHSDDFILKALTEKGISADYNQPMTEEQIKRLGVAKQRQIYNNCVATNNLVNIQQAKGEDLEIVDTDKYCYVMTYSFPCQDLSSAGLGKGMEKGSGTRSGMLWEVERLLDECKDLPQVLLMENVPEVIGTNNIQHFAKWLEKLESLGYHCYWQVLNAKDFGVPQNRERCFMVSVLGDYYYGFPQTIKLEKRLKDLLENEVDEKFYLSDKAISGALNTTFNCGQLQNRTEQDGIMPTLMARDYKDPKLVVEEPLICASRGRNIENGDKTQQQLEINPSGCSNTLTSVQKDNYVIEPNPKVLEYNLKTKLCNDLIYNGKVQENDVIRHNYTTSKDGNCVQANNESPTLDTRCDCLGVVVNDKCDNDIDNPLKGKTKYGWHFEQNVYSNNTQCIRSLKSSEGSGNIPKVIGGLGEKKSNNGTQWYQQDRIYDDNVAISVTTSFNPYYKSNLRIRKLTPKECGRLQGLKDRDIDLIQTNQSNASCYHLYGDSICVSVLIAIFSKMFGLDYTKFLDFENWWKK